MEKLRTECDAQRIALLRAAESNPLVVQRGQTARNRYRVVAFGGAIDAADLEARF